MCPNDSVNISAPETGRGWYAGGDPIRPQPDHRQRFIGEATMPPRTTLNEKQVVVRRFMDILGKPCSLPLVVCLSISYAAVQRQYAAAAGIYLHPQSGHRYIKWTFFPEHIWDRGVYVRLPREIIFETPNQTLEDRIKTPLRSPWTDETVVIMKAALDASKVKVLPRPPGMVLSLH